MPRGRGPFPALVLAHGYIDPAFYTNGRGLMREQDYLARRGYVVLHTDYRNHASPSEDPRAESSMRLGYTEDVINAVHALRDLASARRPRADRAARPVDGRRRRLQRAGRQPGLVKAAVVFAPVSSDAVDNFDRWIRDDPAPAARCRHLCAATASRASNPAFWRNLSAVNFFDRITEPVLIHHGTVDATCPPW